MDMLIVGIVSKFMHVALFWDGKWTWRCNYPWITACSLSMMIAQNVPLQVVVNLIVFNMKIHLRFPSCSIIATRKTNLCCNILLTGYKLWSYISIPSSFCVVCPGAWRIYPHAIPTIDISSYFWLRFRVVCNYLFYFKSTFHEDERLLIGTKFTCMSSI